MEHLIFILKSFYVVGTNTYLIWITSLAFQLWPVDILGKSFFIYISDFEMVIFGGGLGFWWQKELLPLFSFPQRQWGALWCPTCSPCTLHGDFSGRLWGLLDQGFQAWAGVDTAVGRGPLGSHWRAWPQLLEGWLPEVSLGCRALSQFPPQETHHFHLSGATFVI